MPTTALLRFAVLPFAVLVMAACSRPVDTTASAPGATAAPIATVTRTPMASATPVTPMTPSATTAAAATTAVVAPPVVVTGPAVSAPAATPTPADGKPLYTVVDHVKVDPATLMGWKTWRAEACERCHGAKQEGLVGPSLVNSLKVLTKDEFKTTLLNGRLEKGMPNFSGAPMVVDNLDNLYAYLKGRSDGAIAPGHLEAIATK